MWQTKTLGYPTPLELVCPKTPQESLPNFLSTSLRTGLGTPSVKKCNESKRVQLFHIIFKVYISDQFVVYGWIKIAGHKNSVLNYYVTCLKNDRTGCFHLFCSVPPRPKWPLYHATKSITAQMYDSLQLWSNVLNKRECKEKFFSGSEIISLHFGYLWLHYG